MPTKPAFASIDPASGFTTGLRARWLMNEASGATLSDMSGNGYDVTLSGGYSWVTSGDGAAVSFNGSTAQGFLASNLGLGTSNATLWVRFALNSLSTRGAFLKVGGSTGGGYGIGAGDTTMESDGNNLIGILEGAGWVPTTTPLGTTLRNAAMTIPASGTTTMWDGSTGAGSITNTRVAPDASFSMGYVSGVSTRYSNVTIVEAAVWARILTPTELGTLNADPYAGLLYAAPSIASFTPTSGPGGTLVTLTGADYNGITGVTFTAAGGTVAALYRVDSTTQITCAVPPTATVGPIRVTNALGTGVSGGSYTPTSSGSASPLYLPTNWSDA